MSHNQYVEKKGRHVGLKVGAWAVLDNRGRLLYEPGDSPRFKIFRTKLEADIYVRHGGKGVPDGVKIVPVHITELGEDS